jgi:hypothetical protein
MSSSFAAGAPIPEGQASEATYAFTSDLPAPSTPTSLRLNASLPSSPPIVPGRLATRQKRQRLNSSRGHKVQPVIEETEGDFSDAEKTGPEKHKEIASTLSPADQRAYWDVMEMIRRKRLSIKSFLIGYVTDYRTVDATKTGSTRSVRNSAHMKRVYTLRDALDEPLVLEQLASVTRPRQQFPDKHTAEDLVRVGKEFSVLLKNTHFSQWAANDNTFPDIDAVYAAIQDICPLWTAILEILVRNPDKSRIQDENESDDEQEGEVNKRDRKYRSIIFLITSIILRSRHAKKANKPGMKLALYLHGLGTKRRALQTLSSMGLIPSYSTIERCSQRLVQEGEVCR